MKIPVLAWFKEMAGIYKKGGAVWVLRLNYLRIYRKIRFALERSSLWPSAVDFLLVHDKKTLEQARQWQKSLAFKNLASRPIAQTKLTPDSLRLARGLIFTETTAATPELTEKARRLNKLILHPSGPNPLPSPEKPNILFVVSSLNISGGLYVILKHAALLRERGWDVTFFDFGVAKSRWHEFEGHVFPVLRWQWQILGSFDRVVATEWSTVSFVRKFPRARKKFYLVQNYEAGFYPEGSRGRLRAEQSYCSAMISPVTISRWCQKWLKDRYQLDAKYVPNGLELARFSPVPRDFSDRERIKILIEGDSSAPHKNVAESFAVAALLDSQRFEIHYLSYKGEPLPGWKADRFYHKIPFERVGEVYQNTDILLKSSLLESFSYPPLEMMATGGFVVAVPNGGNLEYLKNDKNCLLYPAGDLKAAVEAIERISSSPELRERLLQGGRQSALERDWGKIAGQVEALYC